MDRKKLYFEVKRLYKRGLGPKRISDELKEIPLWTIKDWLYKGKKPWGKYTRNHPNLEPSISLSYILGVCLGDGSVFKIDSENKYIVKLDVTKEKFARDFQNALSDISLRSHSYRINMEDPFSDKFRVRAYSKDFYEWYNSLSLSDIENIVINNSLEKPFLRGLFESDGCRRDACICNTDLDLLKLAKKVAESLGYNSYIKETETPEGNPYFYLRFPKSFSNYILN